MGGRLPEATDQGISEESTGLDLVSMSPSVLMIGFKVVGDTVETRTE